MSRYSPKRKVGEITQARRNYTRIGEDFRTYEIFYDLAQTMLASGRHASAVYEKLESYKEDVEGKDGH